MAIPEIDKLKAKYPQYANIPEQALLQSIAKKYPQYQGIADREFGTVKASPPPTPLQKLSGDMEKKTWEIRAAVEPPLQIAADTIGGTLADVSGAAFKAVGVEPRVMGAALPEAIDFWSEKVESPYTSTGEEPKGWKTAKDVASVYMLADLAKNVTSGLLNDPLIKLQVDKINPKILYTKAQSQAVDTLKATYKDILQRAGYDSPNIDNEINVHVAQKWGNVGKIRRSPLGIQHEVDLLKANKEANVSAIQEMLASSKAGAPPDVNNIIARRQISYKPNETPEYDNWLATRQPLNRQPGVQPSEVPLHPAAEGRELAGQIGGVAPAVNQPVSQPVEQPVAQPVEQPKPVEPVVESKFKVIPSSKGFEVVDVFGNIHGVFSSQQVADMKVKLLSSSPTSQEALANNKVLADAQYAALGPGHAKLREELNALVMRGGMIQEEVEILCEVFKDTDDKFLEGISTQLEGKLKRAGNSHTTLLDRTGIVKLRKGLADVYSGGTQWFNTADLTPTMVFFHEYAHIAKHLLLSSSDLNIIDSVFKSKTRDEWDNWFKQGLNIGEAGKLYYTKNSNEFFVQAFAEYCMRDKIPAEKLRPLFARMVAKLRGALENLIKRGFDKVDRLKPLFEKILNKGKPASGLPKPPLPTIKPYVIPVPQFSIGDRVQVVQGDDEDRIGVISQVSGDSVKVRTPTGSEFTYKKAAIRKLDKAKIDKAPAAPNHNTVNVINEALTNIEGESEKVNSAISHMAKRFGTPFFLGEKYKAFKPVYTAVQDGIDYTAELFYSGVHQLNPQGKPTDLLKQGLTDTVVEVLKTGNLPDIQKEYTPQELVDNFHLTPEEVSAYKNVRNAIAYATKMEIKARKLKMQYGTLSPAQQHLADKLTAEAVQRLGGYFPQTRLSGDWAVFVPPAKPDEPAQFFQLYKTKAEAKKVADQYGVQPYLRNNLRDVYHHLTLADLERLVEAADVDTNDATIRALRNAIKVKTFSKHWIKRDNIPGYDWTPQNVLESTLDYIQGASSKLGKVYGRSKAEAASLANIRGMSPELQAYTRDFIDTYYNSGAIGIKGLSGLMHTWKFTFKVSYLAQNLMQPIATTWPALAGYLPGVEAEKVFGSSYALATRFLKYKLSGSAHGISSELVGILNKLQRQNVLGDQMTRFQMGVHKLSEEEFDKWTGLFGRASEGVNRTHAAICGYRVATDVMGLTNRDAIIEFIKTFIGKTQYYYSRANLPLVIPTAGSMKHFVRAAYTFRHYTVSYLQMLNSQMPWRGAPARQWSRAVSAALLQAGIKGLPFMGLASLGYKMYKEKIAKSGGTVESDLRLALKGYPKEFSDVLLNGGWSLAGADTSQLLGVGDAIPTMGSVAEGVMGAPAGFARQLGKAAGYAIKGDTMKALEYGSPDAIRSLFRAYRYAKEGLRKDTGEKIMQPSELDVALTAGGFQALSISQAWAQREAMTSIEKASKDKSSAANQKLARLLYDQDYEGHRKALLEINEYNKNKKYDERIHVTPASIMAWMKKLRGVSDAPKVLREKERSLTEVFRPRK
jgi:hypothetical protein